MFSSTMLWATYISTLRRQSGGPPSMSVNTLIS